MSSIGRDVLTKFDADFYTAVEDLGIAGEIPDFEDPCDALSCDINKECVVDYPDAVCKCLSQFEEVNGICLHKSQSFNHYSVQNI